MVHRRNGGLGSGSPGQVVQAPLEGMQAGNRRRRGVSFLLNFAGLKAAFAARPAVGDSLLDGYYGTLALALLARTHREALTPLVGVRP